MKQVFIVRHAKAVPYGYDDDFNRKLKVPRGFNDAMKVSNELKNYNSFPDLIISSPAIRALKTAHIFADTFQYPLKDIKIEDDLYDGISTHEFVEMLKSLPNDLNNVYIFGHNPTVYYLVKGLVPSFNDDMPTCSTVAVEFDTDTWESVETGGGNMSFHLMPRMFK